MVLRQWQRSSSATLCTSGAKPQGARPCTRYSRWRTKGRADMWTHAACCMWHAICCMLHGMDAHLSSTHSAAPAVTVGLSGDVCDVGEDHSCATATAPNRNFPVVPLRGVVDACVPTNP